MYVFTRLLLAYNVEEVHKILGPRRKHQWLIILDNHSVEIVQCTVKSPVKGHPKKRHFNIFQLNPSPTWAAYFVSEIQRSCMFNRCVIAACDVARIQEN